MTSIAIVNWEGTIIEITCIFQSVLDNVTKIDAFSKFKKVQETGEIGNWWIVIVELWAIYNRLVNSIPIKCPVCYDI